MTRSPIPRDAHVAAARLVMRELKANRLTDSSEIGVVAQALADQEASLRAELSTSPTSTPASAEAERQGGDDGREVWVLEGDSSLDKPRCFYSTRLLAAQYALPGEEPVRYTPSQPAPVAAERQGDDPIAAVADVLDVGDGPSGQVEVVLTCSREQARAWGPLLYKSIKAAEVSREAPSKPAASAAVERLRDLELALWQRAEGEGQAGNASRESIWSEAAHMVAAAVADVAKVPAPSADAAMARWAVECLCAWADSEDEERHWSYSGCEVELYRYDEDGASEVFEGATPALALISAAKALRAADPELPAPPGGGK